MDLLQNASCGSYLLYVPKGRGGGDREELSRKWCYAIKQGNQSAIAKIARSIAGHPNEPGVRSVLGSDVVLVPMPQSAPRRQEWAWPGDLLAKALFDHGMGAQVLYLLRRVHSVQKAATALPGQRPRAVDHLASFEVAPTALRPERIAIVDDVVTTGATMLAAISAVSYSLPGASVRGFAFIRTQSQGALARIRRPKLSEIDLRANGLTRRAP